MVRSAVATVALCAGVGLLLLSGGVAWPQASAQEIARGKYVFGATGGCGCHTVKGSP
jgi:hypothetical protein